MSPREINVQALFGAVEQQALKIEGQYNRSLNARTIDPQLQVDIKNAFENLRSVLDYLAADIRERYCPTLSASDRFYFPICPNKKAFDDRLDQWFRGLRQSSPPTVSVLQAAQPFQPGQEWLGLFNQVNNDNKHSNLVPQERTESQQTRVTGRAGQVSWGRGVVFSGRVSVLGVPIDPNTQLPVLDPSIKVERITWVDFQLQGVKVSALGLLKQALAGIRGIDARLRPLL